MLYIIFCPLCTRGRLVQGAHKKTLAGKLGFFFLGFNYAVAESALAAAQIAKPNAVLLIKSAKL